MDIVLSEGFMNQNDASYSNGRRRNQRRNERKGERRNERRKEERSRKSKDVKESKERRSKGGKGSFLQKELLRALQRETAENENAIRAFRADVKTCEICGKPISPDEICSAVSNKATGNPAHFDCVLRQVSSKENPGPNEKVTYIGQGRFAVLHFENPHDLRHFTIRRLIEWEDRDNRLEWRNEMAGLFSQIK